MASPISSTYDTSDLNQYVQQTNPAGTNDFFYDDDGNLISLTKDGVTTLYTYNAENRLISVEPQTPGTGDKKSTFLYDYFGRRVRKTVSTGMVRGVRITRNAFSTTVGT